MGAISRVNDTMQLPAQGVAALAVHHAARSDYDESMRRRLLTQAVGATVVAAVAVSVLAEPLLRIGFGQSFAPAAGSLRLFALAAIPAAAVAILLPMVAVHRRVSALLCQMATLGVVVAGDVLLIPSLGLGGVAITAVVAQLVATMLLGANVRTVHTHGDVPSGLAPNPSAAEVSPW
jgi:O-antigen/teichoic acid export membrane protein